MPGVSPPRDNLKQLLARINGYKLPAAWWDEPRPNNPTGWIELTEMSMVAQGCDESRRDYDPVLKVQTLEVLGLRKWIVQVKAYTYTPRIKALDVIEKIKIRLGKPATYQQYQAWGLALQDWGTTIVFPNPQDEHIYSAASCDITWGFRISDIDLETENEGFIGEATGTGTVTGATNPSVPWDSKKAF